MKYRTDTLLRQLRLEPERGEIWIGNERAFLLELPAFAAFRRELIAEMGTTAAKRLLHHMGYAAGSSDARLARKLRNDESNQAFMAGPRLHELEGVVRVETLRMEVDVKTGHHYVEQLWHGSIEASAHLMHHRQSAEPVCWMQTGHASGFNSAFFGRAIHFKEVECVGMGHAHCRIIGKPLEEWEEDDRGDSTFSTTRFINASLQENTSSVGSFDTDLIGADPNFMAICKRLEKLASTSVTVLFQGETGVGKERFAQLLHRMSDRAEGPFVAVNCAALPESLIESELFGVEKGAFTGASHSRAGKFEQADGGTLFLDEIGTLTPVAQDKLLRVLQEREVDRLGSDSPRKVNIRLVAATNADLAKDVKAGRFREDLYYRINVIPVRLPPLRERHNDIPLLIRHFIKKFSARHSRPVVGLTPGAVRALLQHTYPGNIRELENMIERGVVLADPNEPIDVTDLFMGTPFQPAIREDPTEDAVAQWLEHHRLEELIDEAVDSALKRSEGNISQAARLLGISRRQLEYRLKKPKT